MAYNGANLSCMAETFPGDFKIWVYTSADAIATVRGAGYFSDGVTRGMKARDVIYVRDTATPTTYLASVASVSGVAATIGTGTVIAE